MALTDRGAASREAGDRDRAARDFDEAADGAGSIARDDEYYNDAKFQLAPRVIELDSARAADEVFLDQIKARPAQ
jgi:hypothetical protein